MKLGSFILVLFALSPLVAMAHPKPAEARARTQTVHDRTPKVRLHESRPHQR
jgi:hypothetical protein